MKTLVMILLSLTSLHAFTQNPDRGDRGDREPNRQEADNNRRGGFAGPGNRGGAVYTDSGLAVFMNVDVTVDDETTTFSTSIKAYDGSGLAWETDLSANDNQRPGQIIESGNLLALTMTSFPAQEDREAGVEATASLVAIDGSTGAEAWNISLPSARINIEAAGNGDFFASYAQRDETSVSLILAYISGGSIVYEEVIATRTVEEEDDETDDR